MRRKSERVKDKDKPSEKKVDKSSKKSRRSSRRRKKSSSSSEESETDEYDSSFKSCKDDVEEEIPSGRSVPERSNTTNAEDDAKEPALTPELQVKEHHNVKKHSAEEVKEIPTPAEHSKETKEGTVEETAVVENLEKPKESSVWQVKSTEGSGGEISKLKLCIVRPPEAVEPEPRKRKKLSRMPHRESDTGSGESEERTAHDVQDEKSKSRKAVVGVSDESKCEGRNRTDKRQKSENSSDEEQQIDSSVATPVAGIPLSNKGNAEEVSQDTPMKVKDVDDQAEEKKETRIGTGGNGTNRVDRSGVHQISCDPVHKSSVETSDLQDKDTKPSSSAEIISGCKEINASSLEEQKENISTTSEEHKVTATSGEIQVSCNISEEKPAITALSNTSGKVPDMVETVSNSRELPVEKDKNNKLKNVDLTKEKTKSQNISDTKAVIRKSSEKVPAALKKSTSRDSSDSEEERLSYRKLQETKKKSHRLTRVTSDSSEKQSKESASGKTSNSKVETSSNKCHDLQNTSKSTNKHGESSKNSKYKDLSRDSTRLERKKYIITDTKSTERPQVKEKVFLKRSFSRVNDSTSSALVAAKDDELSGHENRHTLAESAPTTSETQPNPTRKRRWGANKATTTVKKPTLSISSDSLKHLIPEVKPLPMSEVHLTEEEDEEEEGEVLDRVDESFEIETEVKTEKRREEVVATDNQPEEKELLYPLPMVPNPPEGKSGTVRKISIVSADTAHLQRSPSPARHRVTNILYITNLVRPFTVNQLRELLARTGSIVDNGFWIDKIKSKCYVQYETETEARETRHALHGVRWPVSNPKQLCVDYAKKEDMDLARDLAEGNHIPRKTEPLKVERMDGWLADQSRDKDREPVLREDRDRERDRDRVRGKDRHPVASLEVLEKTRETKMPISIREWDLGKMDMGSFDDRVFHREDRGERERRLRKERSHRSPSREPPGRKVRKKDEEAPAKLLDDLFKKTKVTPCVYWLPLTADQIVVKEEMRRKHMAEHERRMAEMRKAEKAERERHRARLQGRTSQRRFDDRDRDKRRHRSLSTSPKK